MRRIPRFLSTARNTVDINIQPNSACSGKFVPILRIKWNFNAEFRVDMEYWNAFLHLDCGIPHRAEKFLSSNPGVPHGSVVKCLTRNPGVLGLSCTGSSGFFHGSVLG